LPRVATIDVVAEPLIVNGIARRGGARAGRLAVAPASTFPSGCGALGRLQRSPAASSRRVNIARGFISDLPILLLDEPTVGRSTAANGAVVVGTDRGRKKNVRGRWRWWRSCMTTKSGI